MGEEVGHNLWKHV
jgi:hypothetical protein